MRRLVSIFALSAGVCIAGDSHRFDPSALDPEIVDLQVLPGPEVLPVLRGIASSSDGASTFLPSPDGLRLLRINTEGRVQASLQFVQPISRIVSSPTGELLAVLSEQGGTTSIVNSEDLSLVSTLVGIAPRGAAFTADGTRLYVAGASGLQTFELATSNLSNATSLGGSAADVVVIENRLLVATPDLGQVSVLDSDTLGLIGTVSVAPGTSVLAAYNGLAVAASSVADTLSIIDSATLNVLKTLALHDPESIAMLDSISVVCREGTKLDTVELDHLNADFGERRTLSTLAPGATLVTTNLLGAAALSKRRTQLTRLSKEAVSDLSRTDSLLPARGVPGTLVLATGQYGTGPSAAFLRNETLEAYRPAMNTTDTSFEAEVPLETGLGIVQMWVSRSTAKSLAAKSFVASSPASFLAIGSFEAIDDLLHSLEEALGNGSLSQDGRAFLQAAIAGLQNAKAQFGEGKVGNALAALAGALNALDASASAGVAIQGARLTSAYVVQYTVFSKLDPTRRVLGGNDKDIKKAENAFEHARTLLCNGQLSNAVQEFVSAYSSVEAAIQKARRLRPAQAVTILRKAANELDQLRQETHTRMMLHHHHDAHHPFHDAVKGIGWPGHQHESALGYMSKFRPDKSVAKMRDVLKALAQEGHGTEDLQELACGSMERLVREIADAVEANIGPYDDVVIRARKFLEDCETHEAAGEHDAALGSLVSAMGDPELGASSSSAPMQLFQATYTDTTECHPWVIISEIESLCVDHDSGMINPNPLHFEVTLLADVPDAFGQLFVSIKRAKGGQLVFRFPTRNVIAPSIEPYDWDGRDSNGQIVQMSGAAKQEDLVVEAEFICFSSVGSTPHSAADQRLFTIVAHGGLVVKPGHACKCASEPDHQVFQQFRAFKCTANAGLEDVTEDCLWTLDNPGIGQIGARTGLFQAGIGVQGKSRVIATLLTEPMRGEAKLTVNPEQGGIVEPSVDLCINGTYDFDVAVGCDAEGDCIKQNDQEYTWTVSDPAKGSVTADGFFTAQAFGTVTVTAAGPGGTFTATVNIREVDEISVVEAPTVMCVGDNFGQFTVQLSCNGMPKQALIVNFSATPPMTVQPPAAVTDPAGLATGLLSVPLGVPAGSSIATASALGMSAIAPILIEEVDELRILEAPTNLCVDEEGFQLFTVQALCHGIGRGQVLVTFTSGDGRVRFSPSSALTFGDGRISTRVIPTGIPSAAVGSSTIIATAGSISASSNLTVRSISVAVDPPAAVCHDGSDTVQAHATILPEGTASWFTPGLAIVSQTETGTVSTVTLKGASGSGGTTTITASTGNCSATAQVDLVKVNQISFDKEAICADGFDSATASATIVPLGRQIRWSISGRFGAAGTVIDENSGVITAGTQGGVITVRAADSALDDCYSQADYDIVHVTISVFPSQIFVNSAGSILAASTAPANRGVVWTIEGNALGATIFPFGLQEASLSAGSEIGFIKVRAADAALPDCYDEVFIEIIPSVPIPRPSLVIRGAGDFIVPFSNRNVVRFDVIGDSVVRMSEVTLQVFDKNGANVRELPSPHTTGVNRQIFWDGLRSAGVTLPLTEELSPYQYRLRGFDTQGREVLSNQVQASVEEHELSIVASDLATDPQRLTGRIDVATLNTLEVQAYPDGQTGPQSSMVGFAVETQEASQGQEVLLRLMDTVVAQDFFRRFYTTPTRESDILYTIVATQRNRRVRDVAGNPWDMNPDTQDALENRATLRFDVNRKGLSKLTTRFERTIDDTGEKIPNEPIPPAVERNDD